MTRSLAGTSYAGFMNCNATGTSTTATCGYDPVLERIFWTGTIGPDLDATNAANADNEIVITFQVTVPDTLYSAENNATIDADLNGNGVIDPGGGEITVAGANAIWYSDTLPPVPDTGFKPGGFTDIPAQSKGDQYNQFSNVWMEIPALGVKTDIVGVPLDEDSWDVTWLASQVGWLEGSAFPSYNGNSIVTAHVYLPSGAPGPFINLDQLGWDDKIIVHAFGSSLSIKFGQLR